MLISVAQNVFKSSAISSNADLVGTLNGKGKFVVNLSRPLIIWGAVV